MATGSYDSLTKRLSSLYDVRISTNTLVNGYVLTYNSTTGYWEPSSPGGTALTAPLTGLTPTAGTPTASNTILEGFNYLTYSVTNIEAKYVRTTRFESIGAGTTGTVTIPANNTIILDDFGGTVDAVISGITSGRPNNLPVYDSNSNLVATTFDTNGAFVLTSEPAGYPVAILYRTRCTLPNYDDTASNIVGAIEITPSHNGLAGLDLGDYRHISTNSQTFTGDKTFSGVLTASNLSGTNTGNETTTTIGTLISGATAKTTPADADVVAISDSAASNVLKSVSWANLSAYVRTGRTTAASSGTIGEAISTNVSNVSVTNSTSYTTVATLTLPSAGNWTIDGGLLMNPGDTNVTGCGFKLTTKGVAGTEYVRDIGNMFVTGGNQVTINIPSRTINVTVAEVSGGSNTVVLTGRSVGGNCGAFGYLNATRTS